MPKGQAARSSTKRPPKRSGSTARSRNGGGSKYETKRQELIEAAAACFRRKGYEATTLSDIARRVGADRASLYYYVSGKEELLHEALKEALDLHLSEAEEISKLDVAAPEKMRMLIERQMATQEANYPHLYLYIQADMHKMFRGKTKWARRMASETRRYEEIVLGIIQSGIDEGSFRPDLSVQLLGNVVFGMTNWAHRWFKPGHPFDAAEVSEVFSTVFLGGVEK